MSFVGIFPFLPFVAAQIRKQARVGALDFQIALGGKLGVVTLYTSLQYL